MVGGVPVVGAVEDSHVVLGRRPGEAGRRGEGEGEAVAAAGEGGGRVDLEDEVCGEGEVEEGNGSWIECMAYYEIRSGGEP